MERVRIHKAHVYIRRERERLCVCVCVNETKDVESKSKRRHTHARAEYVLTRWVVFLFLFPNPRLRKTLAHIHVHDFVHTRTDFCLNTLNGVEYDITSGVGESRCRVVCRYVAFVSHGFLFFLHVGWGGYTISLTHTHIYKRVIDSDVMCTCDDDDAMERLFPFLLQYTQGYSVAVALLVLLRRRVHVRRDRKG